MKKIIFVLCCIFLGSFSVTAQMKNPNFDKQVEAIKKLDFLTGNWEGSGWIMLGQNNRENFTINETIQPKLNGVITTIEGLGKNGDKIVHNAFAVINYDLERSVYRWQAFTKDGFYTDAVADVSDRKIIWRFQNNYGQVRYTISLNENGNWHEIGEFSRDLGKTWFKNFEMELRKVK